MENKEPQPNVSEKSSGDVLADLSDESINKHLDAEEQKREKSKKVTPKYPDDGLTIEGGDDPELEEIVNQKPPEKKEESIDFVDPDDSELEKLLKEEAKPEKKEGGEAGEKWWEKASKAKPNITEQKKGKASESPKEPGEFQPTPLEEVEDEPEKKEAKVEPIKKIEETKPTEPEAKKSFEEKPKLILPEDQPKEKSSVIEVVTGFGKKEYGAQDVKNIEARRNVREKRKQGEVVTSAELSKLTDIERGEKKYSQEAPVAIKTKEELTNSDAEFLSTPGFEKDAKRTVEAFRNITTNESGSHRHLAKERNEMVARNIEARGGIIIRGKEAIEEARQKISKKEALKVENELHKKAMDTLIARLPEKYKKNEETLNGYIESIKDKLGLDGENRDIAFDNLVNDGYLVENAKKRWFSFEFKIPNIDKEKEKEPFIYNPTLHFESLIKKASLDIKSQAEKRANFKIDQGRIKIREERQKCVKEIVANVVSEYKAKQLIRETPLPEEKKEKIKRPKLKIERQIGERRTPEEIKTMEKIRKDAEKDIKKAKEKKEKIENLIKKKKKGELLTQKEVAFLRASQLSQKQEK